MGTFSMRLLILSVLCAIALSMPVPLTAMEHGEAIPIPSSWAEIGSVNYQQKRLFIIAVKQQNVDQLEQIFNQVSNPQHPNYGKYLSVDEITQLVQPSQDALNRLGIWLQEHDIEYTLSGNNDLIKFVTTLEKAEKLFQFEYKNYQHASGRQHASSTGPYHMPSHLAQHVDYVTGILGFPEIRRSDNPLTPPQPTNTLPIGPSDLRKRYNITDTADPSVNNSRAVAEFQDQYYSPNDLKVFFQKFVPGSSADTVRKVYGENSPDAPGVEAELDIQYIMGVVPGIATDFYILPGFDFWTGLTSWAGELASQHGVALVHSVSYGSQSQYPSTDLRDRFNTDMMKLGARGLSIIFASGDDGAGCEACLKFRPSFPATAPYVTSVGATRFLQNSVGPEGAVQSFGSGGGFSDHFPRPSYQNDAVQAYLNSGKAPASHWYYPKNRATPDVACHGIGFQVVVSGGVESVGGTSASAPTFAAIVSLLNQEQIKRGRPPLGFLNPWIYQTFAKDKSAFWDVTQGNNRHGCCIEGFECETGWDPVTGVGNPNYVVLKQNLP